VAGGDVLQGPGRQQEARGPSDELRCTLLVGSGVVVAPCGLRIDDIQRDTAELSWLPSNSNYGHTVFLDGAEHAVLKPGRCRLRFVNLKATTVYKVTVVARPHQVPWQLPLEQREKKEAGVEFCTQAAGQLYFLFNSWLTWDVFYLLKHRMFSSASCLLPDIQGLCCTF